MKNFLILCLFFALCAATPNAQLEPDAQLGPRSTLLDGGALESRSGSYMVTFPPPNDCVELGPIKAKSRTIALYTAVSRGGFTLAHSDGGLTVWTIEEWNDLKKEPWYSDLRKAHEQKCGKGDAMKRGQYRITRILPKDARQEGAR